ncbi:hypothetical protein HAX54_013011, partial [Datura stramonium]|nr:hypothetical protein [Datura stramonium]
EPLVPIFSPPPIFILPPLEQNLPPATPLVPILPPAGEPSVTPDYPPNSFLPSPLIPDQPPNSFLPSPLIPDQPPINFLPSPVIPDQPPETFLPSQVETKLKLSSSGLS